MKLPKKRLVVLGLLALFALALVAFPVLAHAQGDIPVPSANNPNSPQLVGYSVLSAMFMGAVLRALSPANTSLPFAPSVNVLHAINVVGACATTVLLAIVGGTPWNLAIAGGVLPLVTGFTHVGAAKGAKQIAAASVPPPPMR
jgi:hypothetical protein